jgi:hypothetical protein
MAAYTTSERTLSAVMPATSYMSGARRRGAASSIRRAWSIVRDGLMVLAVVLCIPFIIIGIGLPIALIVQLVLWIGRLL